MRGVRARSRPSRIRSRPSRPSPRESLGSTGFSIDQRDSEALQRIEAYFDIWNVSLVVFGLHLVLIGYLAFRSGYVPRVLGVLLAVAGAGYLVDSLGGLLVEDYSLSVGAVTFIGEALLMVWLLVRGRKVQLRA